MSDCIERIHVVVPAAGVGRRMGGSTPKQYLPILGRSVLEHTLSTLLNVPQVVSVNVALSPEDGYWTEVASAQDPRVERVPGGSERVYSVLNALIALLERGVAEDEWVLVHDAARPCLRLTDVENLLAQLAGSEGGLLAAPVRDTMKRSDAHGYVLESVPRECLWHALTPQVFRLGPLKQAIETALKNGVNVTDEASAMEAIGIKPKLVAGAVDNIKITHPEDLPLATQLLESR